MLFDRNTATIVIDSNRPVSMNGHIDSIGIPCHHFVYTIVDNFVYEMVKFTLISRSNIHTGTHAYSFQTFEYLAILSAITIPTITVHLFVTIPTSDLTFSRSSIIIVRGL